MKINVKTQYPYSEDYDFKTKLVRLNLEDEMKKDIDSGKGFYIKEHQQNLKKSLKSSDSIYSEKFMKTLQDPDAFSDRYSCKCGATTGSDWAGMFCKYCNTKVEFIGDDFSIFGWIKLKEPYKVIHPNLYKSLEFYIGEANLQTIIEPDIDLNENGNRMTAYDKKIYASKIKRKYRRHAKADSTYAGIGMIEFVKKFDEILEYFHKKNKLKKIEYYEDIKANRDKIFTGAIPVFSTGMRPFKVEGGRFTFEGTNAIFNIMAKLAEKINEDEVSFHRIEKYRTSLLWDMQERFNSLYVELVKILEGKKGNIRLLVGGRCNFTSRVIITPDPKLRMDEVHLPYNTLVELLQQTIVNVLAKSYNITYAHAYSIWYKSQRTKNQRVYEIIDNIIKSKDGIPVIINRNPTINYGSILAMRCTGINDTYTMSMPLLILGLLTADFDGDCLNVLYIPNKTFWKEAMGCFNPRNAMIISHNDGMFNNVINVFKDILITANGLLALGRDTYTKEELDEIRRIKEDFPD